MNADEFLDITDVVCPMTFVKTKVALEDLDDGQILERICRAVSKTTGIKF